MGIRAHLQKGRTKPGLTLPADAQAKINEANDRGTLEKWLGDKAPGPKNIQVEPADASKATLTTSPMTPPETNESLNDEVAARKAAEEEAAAKAEEERQAAEAEAAAKKEDSTLETGILTADGEVVKGGEVESTVEGGETKVVPDDMQLLEGVGGATEQKLYEAGYVTYEQLMEAAPAELAEKVDGLSESNAKGVVKQAKKYSKLKAKGKL